MFSKLYSFHHTCNNFPAKPPFAVLPVSIVTCQPLEKRGVD